MTMLALAAGVAPRGSSVALDVDRAEADARDVMRELHGFCDSPRVPPRMDALRLCKLAKEVPSCEGFQKQCQSFLEPKPPEPTPWLDALGRLISAIAPYLGWTFVALAVGAVLYLIIVTLYRYFTRDRKDDDLDGATDVVVTEAARRSSSIPAARGGDLARAKAALARGDLRTALFGFLHASLRALDVRGAIHIERDRTNGEYVRSCADEGAQPSPRHRLRWTSSNSAAASRASNAYARPVVWRRCSYERRWRPSLSSCSRVAATRARPSRARPIPQGSRSRARS
ncbi:MAG: hypothetical protein U0235_24535 [Polyangiaceae bacterium]